MFLQEFKCHFFANIPHMYEEMPLSLGIIFNTIINKYLLYILVLPTDLIVYQGVREGGEAQHPLQPAIHLHLQGKPIYLQVEG